MSPAEPNPFDEPVDRFGKGPLNERDDRGTHESQPSAGSESAAPTALTVAAERAAVDADGEFDVNLVQPPLDDEQATEGPSRRSWLDRLYINNIAEFGRERLYYWSSFAIVVVLAALTRLIGLANPRSIVFDETFYIKDAWTLFNLGYEATWPEDANAQWEAGDPNTYNTDPAFVVHPPVGKWLIGFGESLLGAANPFGWRVMVALFSVALVAVTFLLAHRLLRSTTLAALAAGLLAIDGVAIVLGRVALLDSILATFALTGALFMLIDRSRQIAQLEAAVSATEEPSKLGPVLWRRPWLIAAAVMFGLAAGVKWSGAYYLAVFCIYVVFVDLATRYRLKVRMPELGALRQALVTFVMTVPVAALVYLSSWIGWFQSSNGYLRTWADDGNQLPGVLGALPNALQSWLEYHRQIAGFHTGLTADHPYASPAWTWPLLGRPTYMFYEGGAGTSASITPLGNPLIWWFGAAAVLFCAYLMIARGNWRATYITVGMLGGFVPWLVFARTSVFQFYSISYEPFLVLALVFVVGFFSGKVGETTRYRRIAVNVAVGFVAAIVIVSALFSPMWFGISVPDWYRDTFIPRLRGWI